MKERPGKEGQEEEDYDCRGEKRGAGTTFSLPPLPFSGTWRDGKRGQRKMEKRVHSGELTQVCKHTGKHHTGPSITIDSPPYNPNPACQERFLLPLSELCVLGSTSSLARL
ncbi:hypothetical protein MRX96_014146 [Rhipicephalus microplus]